MSERIKRNNFIKPKKYLGGVTKNKHHTHRDRHTRAHTCTQRDWCPVKRPRLGPGHTAPPLSGKDVTWPKRASQSWTTAHLRWFHSPFLSLLPLSLFFLALLIFLKKIIFLFSFLEPDWGESSPSYHCWCHRCPCGSAEVLPLSKPAVSPLFLVLFFSSSPFF